MDKEDNKTARKGSGRSEKDRVNGLKEDGAAEKEQECGAEREREGGLKESAPFNAVRPSDNGGEENCQSVSPSQSGQASTASQSGETGIADGDKAKTDAAQSRFKSVASILPDSSQRDNGANCGEGAQKCGNAAGVTEVGSRNERAQTLNPFEEYAAVSSASADADKTRAKKKPVQLKPSKKIAYSAVAAAIAVVASVITVFLPVKVMPLVLASFCFFLALVKCGVVYGLLTAAATVLITFLAGGLSTSLIFLCVTFVPYSLICLLMRRFDYKKWSSALIRAAAAIVFINLSFAAVYFIAKYVVLDGFDVLAAVGKAGYLIAALLVSAVAVLTDFLFVQCDAVITPKIR